VQWDRLFEDLEGQLASEWEAERTALDAESERLRISRLELRARMRTLCHVGGSIVVEIAGGSALSGALEEIGADWVAMTIEPRRGTSLVPMSAIRGVCADHGQLLSSLDPGMPGSPVRERMTLGFVLRDLARRRIPVTIEDVDGTRRHGTIDRAGADHLDLAVHDAGSPRRAQEVRAFHIIAFSAITRVDLSAAPR
jgi:hypothetical protein